MSSFILPLDMLSLTLPFPFRLKSLSKTWVLYSMNYWKVPTLLVFFCAPIIILFLSFLESHGPQWQEIEFDFLIGGEFLRVSLLDHLKAKDISTETTVDIEYIERLPAPEPEDSLNHDDWVSAVHCYKQWYKILNGQNSFKVYFNLIWMFLGF